MTHWFFDTAGIGSLIVFALGISVFLAYARMLRWIQTTPPLPHEEPGEERDGHGPQQTG